MLKGEDRPDVGQLEIQAVSGSGHHKRVDLVLDRSHEPRYLGAEDGIAADPPVIVLLNIVSLGKKDLGRAPEPERKNYRKHEIQFVRDACKVDGNVVLNGGGGRHRGPLLGDAATLSVKRRSNACATFASSVEGDRVDPFGQTDGGWNLGRLAVSNDE